MTLRESLRYEPRELKFGTSGRRGEVEHLTQLEIYINALGEIEYLQTLPLSEGGVVRGETFYYAQDLRPSSARLAQAVARAAEDAGMRPVDLGSIPTPALTCFALQHQKGSVMVTGSHIPFHLNGYKLNTSAGELLKEQEAPVNASVAKVRQRVYEQPVRESSFDEYGSLKSEGPAWSGYVARYRDFFGSEALKGLRLLAYQHSAVGRDLLVEILRSLGAEVTPAGRSETFVPIDTENIGADQLETIQALVDAQPDKPFAVVSTDGDSDRPLLLHVEATGRVRFFGGDLLGMVVAQFLGADAVVVPISCNDAIDRGPLAAVLEPKTRIGSPFVIAGMEAARARGRKAVCGWEANGGFLTGSDIERNGAVLKALPTRDAVLPIAAALAAAREQNCTLADLFAKLPARFSRAALLKDYPRPVSRRVVQHFTTSDRAAAELESILGLPVDRLDYTDGVRVILKNGDVVHFRPSGNADEFRIYAVADSQERADELAAWGVREPDGILRQLERVVAVSAEDTH